jgi:DNA-binding MarR family transcriptional regulator
MMSLAEKAVTSVYRTNEVLRRHAAPIFESEGISAQQYNVLRVLRGAGGHGLPAQELGARMLQNTPGVTRLLDRLESKGFVTRRRPDIDRRLQLCSITTACRKTKFKPLCSCFNVPGNPEVHCFLPSSLTIRSIELLTDQRMISQVNTRR